MFTSKLLFVTACYFLISEISGDCCCRIKNPTTVFYVGKTAVPWNDAVKVCQSVGMSLVTIENKQKNDAIYNFLVANGSPGVLWSSGNRFQDKVNWLWLRQEPALYFSWNGGEPNNARGDEEFISIFIVGTTVEWNDAPSVFEYYPLCEQKICCSRGCSEEQCKANPLV